jgi:hypothetical protein
MQVGTAKALIRKLLREHGIEASLTPVFLMVDSQWVNLASTVEDLLNAFADIEKHVDFVLDTPNGTETVTEIRIEDGSLLLTVESPRV